MFLELGEETVAGLLCVSEQHGGVLVEEDGIVDSGVAYTQRSLHHNNLEEKIQWPFNNRKHLDGLGPSVETRVPKT